jgi:hypothetical protein
MPAKTKLKTATKAKPRAKPATKTKATPRKVPAASKTSVPADIRAYDRAQPEAHRAICVRLGEELSRGLPKAESKVWHGGPVWFLDGNPVAGYWSRKGYVQLLFWSGQSFDEPELEAEGKFKAAQARISELAQIRPTLLKRWLRKAKTIQWDYKNIVKRRGKLEKLGDW